MPRTPVPRDLLPGWQRPAVRFLLVATLLMGGTGLFLVGSDGASAAAAWALVVHIVAALVALPLMLVFVIPHARAHMRRKPVIAVTGALVLALSLFTALTGAQLTLFRSALVPAWSLPGHWIGGGAMLLAYALHRRYGANPAPWSRLAGSVAALLALGVVLVGWESATGVGAKAEAASVGRAERFAPLSLPSSTRTRSGAPWVDAQPMLDVERCAECHEAIVRDHLRSAHKHSSFNNPFYRRSIEDMRERFELVNTNWCAGCHDPALLLTGAMDDPELDMDSVAAQAGLTCLSCHAIETRGLVGNGAYMAGPHRVYAWETSDDPRVREAHDVLLQIKPEGHADSLRPDEMSEGVFCATCHRADVPAEVNGWRFFAAQTTYDEWDDSGVSLNNARSFYHPEHAKRCQDCHMPLRLDPDDPSADAEGYVRSHLFAAANSALPFLRGDQDMIDQQARFLRTTVRIDITGVLLPPDPALGPAERLVVPAPRVKPSVRAGDVVEAHVVVRNKGVGHRFPSGTADSNEVWVSFEAQVGEGEPFYVSGAVDPDTGLVDRTAEAYRSYVLDREGKRMVSRLGPDVYTPIYQRRIGPGTAEVVRYRFRVPVGAKGALRLRAVIRYRKFMRPFIDYAFGEDYTLEVRQADGSTRTVDLRELPIIDVFESELALPIDAEGLAGAAPAPHEVAADEDLLRVNDLAIAYLLQDDTLIAHELFTEVTRIDPEYADGWVNVARARLRLLDLPGALEALAKAETLRPGWGKSAYFRGAVYQQMLQFERAEAAYRQTLVEFPRDRAALRRLAKVLREQDRPEEALEVLRGYFAIAPKDPAAWLEAVSIYKDLVAAAGDASPYAAGLRAASEARALFKADDQLPQRRGAYLNANPHLQVLERRIHTHRQPGLEGE